MPFNRLKNYFDECADAIRSKTKKTEEIKPEDMPHEINGIYAKPQADSGEYYNIVLEDGSINDIVFYGALQNRRLVGSKAMGATLLEDVTKIPIEFMYMSSLSSLTIHGRVDTIESYAFDKCKSLITMYIQPPKVGVWPDECTNIIPELVTTISDGSFRDCIKLNPKLRWHDNVTKFGAWAFELSDVGLTIGSAELPANLEIIEKGALWNQQIPITKIPESVTKIGDNAFYQNNALTTLTFKGKPSTISSNAFNGCNHLTTINVPWANGAVSGAPWGATNATVNYNYTG